MRLSSFLSAAVGCLFLASTLASSAEAAAAGGIIVDPPGNRSETQPKIYAGSRFLTGIRGSGSFDDKYKRVYALLAHDPVLIAKIKKAAATYGIDPIHVIGAIVGEHTYNIDTFDSLQTYYVKALEYADISTLQFAYHGQTAVQLFAKPQFAKCATMKSNYEIWDCRQTVWNTQFYGKMVDGKLYPPDRLHRVFFRPAYAGQTFGFGQLSPVAALMVTDVVHAKSGLPLLSIGNASQVYQQIMNPDTSLNYVAANIRVSIDLYKSIAGIDISRNPGVTATLYNLGDAATRARELRATNDQRKKAGQAPLMPQENFYGWLINDREAQLRKLL
jgi:hypothetical protein